VRPYGGARQSSPSRGVSSDDDGPSPGMNQHNLPPATVRGEAGQPKGAWNEFSVGRLVVRV
jgi:hypothetical protein